MKQTNRCISNSLTTQCNRIAVSLNNFHGACCIYCYVAAHTGEHTSRCNAGINKVPEFWCWSCMDYGLIEVPADPSRDSVRYIPCDCKPVVYYKYFRFPEGIWKPTQAELAEAPPF